jgi:membrane-bound ClpP family serine protease
VRRLAIVLLMAAALAGIGSARSGTAQASVPPTDTTPAVDAALPATDATLAPVDVLQVTGLFNGIVIDAIDRAIERAAEGGSQALILQVNSSGSIASPAEMQALIQRVADAPVPIGIWVGPSRHPWRKYQLLRSGRRPRPLQLSPRKAGSRRRCNSRWVRPNLH